MTDILLLEDMDDEIDRLCAEVAGAAGAASGAARKTQRQKKLDEMCLAAIAKATTS